MDIGLYIGELLREQDEINVAGLGTFMKIRLAGSFNSASNEFYPPSYQISFKESEISDLSLIQFISVQKNLSNTAAEELIKKFSEGLLEQLNSSDSVEIQPIGSLHKKKGKLTLIPSSNFGAPDNFFGLKPIPELKTEGFLPVKEEISVTQVSEDIEEEEEEEEIKKSRSWITLFISFLALLIAVSALFYFNSDFNSFIKNKSAGVFSSTNKVEQVAPDLIDSTKISSDLIKNAVDSASIVSDSLQQIRDTAITATNLSETIVLGPESEVVNYEIITAAFSRKSEADMYIKEIGTKGIQAKIVENMPGKMLKISLGTFLDEESAKKELTIIRKNINKDAWIARVKQSKNPK
jgi:nucleoid DNA-binding protein